MTETDIGKQIFYITPMNKLLILVLVILISVILYDSGFRNRILNAHREEKQALDHQKSQSMLMESLYRSLEIQEKNVKDELAFLAGEHLEKSKGLSFMDSVSILAEQNHMGLEWVEEIRPMTEEHPGLWAISMKGDLGDVRRILLDLLALPRLSGIPMIQIFSWKGSLDVMLNVEVFKEQGPEHGEGKP
ncbi:MAG: hypothetical protein KKD44_25425 [Proteobacteria bacterium]|nr:hypothetical protein [Pseudomonadota bacterium]